MSHVCMHVNANTVFYMINMRQEYDELLHSIFERNSYNLVRKRLTNEANRNCTGDPQRKAAIYTFLLPFLREQ